MTTWEKIQNRDPRTLHCPSASYQYKQSYWRLDQVSRAAIMITQCIKRLATLQENSSKDDNLLSKAVYYAHEFLNSSACWLTVSYLSTQIN